MATAESPTVNKISALDFTMSFYGVNDDDTPKVHPVTIKNHIKRGWLSGEKLGGRWWVFCNSWGEPLYYYSSDDEMPDYAPVTNTSTGNSLADKILASL